MLGLLVGLGLGAWPLGSWFHETILSTLPDDLSAYRDWRPNTTVEVFGADGQKVDAFYVERRYWVELGDLPDHVWQAFLAAEDRRFFEHPGVDLFGVLRAARSNMSGGQVQGGSTLTQQLVKNLLVGKARSYERKLKEAVLAYRLERELSKYEVLQLYLNYVYLGNGNYGVEAAARDYFAVSASELDPAQAATLAGLVPAPSRYSPRRDPDLARWRRAYVLRRMVEDGYVDPIDAIDHLDAPVALPPRAVAADRGPATAHVTMVRREVRRLLGDELPYAEGLHVHTPYDDDVQRAADAAIRAAVNAHRDRQGPKVVVGQLGEADAAVWTGEPLADGECGRALVDGRRDLNALRVGGEVLPLAAEDRMHPVYVDGVQPPRPVSQQVRGHDLLAVCRSGERLRLDRAAWAEGAAVVVENATGRVVALVGGTTVGLEGFVRATQARRQPGSSFKPYVYAAALARGRSQLDVVQDAPILLPAGGGTSWSPKNYGGGYAGPTTLRRALASSLNTVAVRLALEVGPSEVARMARALGVRTPIRTDITIALGSSEVTPLDQAMAYATLARLGVPVEPVWVDRLVDIHGAEIGARGGPIVVDGQQVATLPGAPLPQVLDPGVAYTVLDMMTEVVRSGTARRAWSEDQQRAGKTGTTNDFLDAWFVGMVPSHTIAVWIGTDGTTTLGDKETGGKAALPAWIEIAAALPPGPARFPVPDEAMLLPHDGQWIGVARGQVPDRALSVPEAGDAPLAHLP